MIKMKLSKSNYFSKEANLKYLSVSQYKSWLSCEAATLAELKGDWEREQSDAMLQGQYVHAWLEGQLEAFREEHPDMFKKDGSLYAKYEICEKVIETIQADELFMKALSGKHEIIFTGELFGCEWKIMIDSYFPEQKRFGDLKVLKSMDDKFWTKDETGGHYENVFDHYGYYNQMAVYAEIERVANGRDSGDYFEPFIAVATKEKYPDKEIISFVSDQESHKDFINNRLLGIRMNIPRILDVKAGKKKPKRCGKCDYCRSTKKLTGTKHYTEFNLY